MESPKGQYLIFRVDASTQIGTGHVMRCLALGQAWQDSGGKVVFITACQNEGLLQRLRDESINLHQLAHPYPDDSDWDKTASILASFPDSWVVLDGYHFDEEYQRRVKAVGNSLLAIDDMAHLKHYFADIVLNQNLHAEQLHYSCEPYTRQLLGSEYVMLRREFLKWKDWCRDIPETARKILVTLGGSDLDNYTLKVIESIQRVNIPDMEVTVVIGVCNPHAALLEAAVKQSQVSIRLVRNVKNMPELMAWADMSVCSAGTAVWELAFMGMPTIALATVPTEEFLIGGLKEYGLFIIMNWRDDPSPERLTSILDRLASSIKTRRQMGELGSRLVDGTGCQKVVHYIAED